MIETWHKRGKKRGRGNNIQGKRQPVEGKYEEQSNNNLS